LEWEFDAFMAFDGGVEKLTVVPDHRRRTPSQNKNHKGGEVSSPSGDIVAIDLQQLAE
jgi:hypothetical protein